MMCESSNLIVGVERGLDLHIGVRVTHEGKQLVRDSRKLIRAIHRGRDGCRGKGRVLGAVHVAV